MANLEIADRRIFSRQKGPTSPDTIDLGALNLLRLFSVTIVAIGCMRSAPSIEVFGASPWFMKLHLKLPEYS